ncbi:MAG: hypothetical protein HY819_08890 [Acidobacteria bacterium]|nr:hypothetical protein [Acidobacteriota bacterium]
MALCPNCQQELDAKMECPKCKLDIIASLPNNKLSSKLGVKSTGKLSSKLRVSKLNSRVRSRKWLPTFLAKSPLAKINVHPVLAAFLVLLLPLSAFLFYFISIEGICFNCLQIAGSYIAVIENNDQAADLEINFFQQGRYIVGNIRIRSKVSPEKPITRHSSFSLNSIVADKEALSFQGFSTKDKSIWIKFNGNLKDNSIIGKLSTNIPELASINNSNILAKKF